MNKYNNVFISHSKEDISFAEKLYEFLENNTYEPWLDKKRILPGQKWDIEIRTALKNADYIIILLSKNSVQKKGYVQREFKLALEYCKEKKDDDIYLIPIKIDDCIVPNELSKFQWIDYSGDESLEKILLSLNNQRQKNNEITENEQSNDTNKNNGNNIDTYNLISFVRNTSKEVPILKYALGVVAIAACSAVIKSYNITDSNVNFPIVTILSIIGLMVVLFLFSLFLKSDNKNLKYAGLILIYSVSILTSLSATLVLGCVFFDKPKKFNDLINTKNTIINTKIVDTSTFSIKRAKLLEVPEGYFFMGTSRKDAEANCRQCKDKFIKPQDCKLEYFTDECPVRKIWVDKFWIDDKEVTQYEYQEYIAAAKSEPIKLTQPSIGPNKPIVGLRWIDAFNYCKWKGKRLPTEAEWEKAARWNPLTNETYKYPWGNEEISCEKANYGRDQEWSEECISNRDTLAEVDAFEKYKSPIGAYNMVGNAWEIVFDDYKSDNTNYPLRNPKIGTNSPSHLKVIKGGGWGLHSVWVRPADRYSVSEDALSPYVGCRCASSIFK